VVAMVAGYAIGGGHILHMLCDLTICADNAVFGQTGPRVGRYVFVPFPPTLPSSLPPSLPPGYAIGGGYILHMLCDLTICADSAVFGQTGLRVGRYVLVPFSCPFLPPSLPSYDATLTFLPSLPPYF